MRDAPFEELSPAVVALNRFEGRDPLQRANRSWLSDRAAMTVVADVAFLADRIVRVPAPGRGYPRDRDRAATAACFGGRARRCSAGSRRKPRDGDVEVGEEHRT